MSSKLTMDAATLILAAQPFSQLLGTRLTELREGHAELELDIVERLLQQDGLVHGGVLAYLCDNALTYAGATALGSRVLTASVDVEYLAAATTGTLRATSTVVHHTRKRAVCDCVVTIVIDGDRPSTCAIARGTVLVLPDAP